MTALARTHIMMRISRRLVATAHRAKLHWRDKVRQNLKRFGIAEADCFVQDKDMQRDVYQEGLQRALNTTISKQLACDMWHFPPTILKKTRHRQTWMSSNFSTVKEETPVVWSTTEWGAASFGWLCFNGQWCVWVFVCVLWVCLCVYVWVFSVCACVRAYMCVCVCSLCVLAIILIIKQVEIYCVPFSKHAWLCVVSFSLLMLMCAYKYFHIIYMQGMHTCFCVLVCSGVTTRKLYSCQCMPFFLCYKIHCIINLTVKNLNLQIRFTE